MRRVLFDKNVPYPLKRHLTDVQVKTAEEEGWAQISNGELISLAELAGYQILLTCDQNLSYQQNLENRTLSMIVLGSNIWPASGKRSYRSTRLWVGPCLAHLNSLKSLPRRNGVGCPLKTPTALETRSSAVNCRRPSPLPATLWAATWCRLAPRSRFALRACLGCLRTPQTAGRNSDD